MTVPSCPEHPTAKPIRARNAGTTTSRWVCLACGKILGDAGPITLPEWERETLTPDNAGELPALEKKP